MKYYTISYKNAEGNSEYVRVVASRLSKAVEFAISKGAADDTIDYVSTNEVDVIE